MCEGNPIQDQHVSSQEPPADRRTKNGSPPHGSTTRHIRRAVGRDGATQPAVATGEAYEGLKPTAGPDIAKYIGLDVLRQRCPHFGDWIRRLESLDIGPQ
ncbi:MAG: DUF4276 family protein [Planctomycetaceae bacterium]|nr:DUF4276 family protein [Planctomycetaceae bacterium]